MREQAGRWLRDVTLAAITAGGGSKCFIHVETRTIIGQGPDGSSYTRKESRLVTSTGAPVEPVTDTEYRVRSTGLSLWLADPKAAEPVLAVSDAGRRAAGNGMPVYSGAGVATPIPPRGRAASAQRPAVPSLDPPAENRFRVLVVDEDADQAAVIAAQLQVNGFEVRTVGTVAEAKAAGFAPHVVVADLGLPGRHGVELVKWAKSLPDPAAVVAVTGFTVSQRLLAAEGFGAAVILLKPVDPLTLVDHVLQACEAQQSRV